MNIYLVPKLNTADPGGDVIIDTENVPWVTHSNSNGTITVHAKDAGAGLFPKEEATMLADLLKETSDVEVQEYIKTEQGYIVTQYI